MAGARAQSVHSENYHSHSLNPRPPIITQLGEKSRSCASWVKLKPEYSGQTPEMDLLVIGAGYGEGKARAGLLCTFMLGVAVPNADGGTPERFMAITRVSGRADVHPSPPFQRRWVKRLRSFVMLVSC